jgi:hypothetical protein
MSESTDQTTMDEAQRCLAAHRVGTLSFGEHVRPVKFIIDNDDGRIICPVMSAALEEPELVLFIPEESDESLQLLLGAEEIDEKDHALSIDRWMAHHGEPDDIYWVACWIDAARHGPHVIDGDAMMGGNVLKGSEAATCRRLNNAKDDLRALCSRFGKMDVEDPVCVGVTPRGLSVRTRFDVIFVPFDSYIDTADALDGEIDRMIADSKA